MPSKKKPPPLSPKRRKGKPGKPPPTSYQDQQKKILLDRSRAKGIFETAKRGETFGPNPGFVDLRIELSVYNAISRQREKLPGKQIELLISSIEEVDDMLIVIKSSLNRWLEGWIKVTRE